MDNWESRIVVFRFLFLSYVGCTLTVYVMHWLWINVNIVFSPKLHNHIGYHAYFFKSLDDIGCKCCQLEVLEYLSYALPFVLTNFRQNLKIMNTAHLSKQCFIFLTRTLMPVSLEHKLPSHPLSPLALRAFLALILLISVV